MDISIWHIWIIVAILLFIVEIFAPYFIAICLGLGCIAAAISSYFDYGITIQFISFSIGSLIGFFGVRPFMLKYAHRKSNKIKTNVDALIGKIAKVIITIDNSKNEGRVLVEGDDWRAETENNEIIETGKKVKILKVDSTILIVKPLN